MARPPSEYRTARQASGLLCFAVAVALALLDAFRTDFEVNVVVLALFLVTGAALFAVDVPIIGVLFGQIIAARQDDEEEPAPRPKRKASRVEDEEDQP